MTDIRCIGIVIQKAECLWLFPLQLYQSSVPALGINLPGQDTIRAQGVRARGTTNFLDLKGFVIVDALNHSRKA